MDTYEKKYKEALEKAEGIIKYYKECNRDEASIEDLETIFPELKESEDERIRKALLEMVHDTTGDSLWIDYNIHKEEALAWLEKQGEHGSIEKEYTFKSIPRLLDMIEPSDKAKAYCQKFIDTLTNEGYNTDAKIVGEVLKGWNGEEVPMAVMDEQKPTDKAEPKFHEGEWVVCEELNTAKIISRDNDRYEVEFIDGNKGFPHIDYIDRNFYLYDVTKDAKDGDVLVDDLGNVCIYQEPSTKLMYHSYCYGNHKHFIDMGGSHEIVGSYPATKSQRDTFFAKMKGSGYEWNAEKKELKKISQRTISAEAKEALYGKPTDEEMKELLRTEYEKGRADTIAEMKSSWSEEDEKICQCLIKEQEEGLDAVRNDKYGHSEIISDLKEMYRERIDWLKSLKERIGG